MISSEDAPIGTRKRQFQASLAVFRVGAVMTPWMNYRWSSTGLCRRSPRMISTRCFQGTGLTHLLVIDIHGDESASAIGLVVPRSSWLNACGAPFKIPQQTVVSIATPRCSFVLPDTPLRRET